MFRLDGKVAVIFGGNGYLGHEFCKALLKSGAIVYNCDIKAAKKEVDQQLSHQKDTNYNFFKIDASKKSEIKSVYKKIIAKEHTVDILVNCTTLKSNDFYLPFEDASLSSWNIGILGNLTIPFLTIQTFIPIMKKNKSGSIINISSVYGIVGNDQRLYEGSNLHELYLTKSKELKQVYSHGVYNAAKGGLNAFTRFLAAYYGKYNIRVNTISPGGIYYAGENKKFLKKYSAKTPLGRKANPDEINGALIFLASDESTYVTGHNLVVDGGFSIW